MMEVRAVIRATYSSLTLATFWPISTAMNCQLFSCLKYKHLWLGLEENTEHTYFLFVCNILHVYNHSFALIF